MALKVSFRYVLAGNSSMGRYTFLITSDSLKFPASVQAIRKLPSCFVGTLMNILLGNARSGIPHVPPRKGLHTNKIMFTTFVTS